MKETLLQDFEWYLPEDASFWATVARQVQDLALLGITKVWLPPMYKGIDGVHEVGYAVYDLYDLGEFDQKGSIPTKYGTKAELLKAIAALHTVGIEVIADVVLNHRMGADGTETVRVREVNSQNRDQQISDIYEADVWTRFDFAARKNKYSSFTWNASHFTGTDYNERNKSHAILAFEGKNWSPNVSKEQGNFDFVMGNDVDFSDPAVVKELTSWGKWLLKTTHVDGFRIDSAKSIDSRFFKPWLKVMETAAKKPLFCVGEYWSGDVQDLLNYLEQCEDCMHLFDVPLHFKIKNASMQPWNYDLHQLFDHTLSAEKPTLACAFVDNHDSQPGQALESWVADEFKTRAYSLILLRTCEAPFVFYGDLWGLPYANKQAVGYLREMIWIRSHLLGDEFVDMNDDCDHIKMCWLVRGEHPVFVIFTGGDWKQKDVVEPTLAGADFVDVCDPNHHVVIADDGAASFTCPPNGIGIYILSKDYDDLVKALY